jgi:hypothetical protein
MQSIGLFREGIMSIIYALGVGMFSKVLMFPLTAEERVLYKSPIKDLDGYEIRIREQVEEENIVLLIGKDMYALILRINKLVVF